LWQQRPLCRLVGFAGWMWCRTSSGSSVLYSCSSWTIQRRTRLPLAFDILCWCHRVRDWGPKVHIGLDNSSALQRTLIWISYLQSDGKVVDNCSSQQDAWWTLVFFVWSGPVPLPFTCLVSLGYYD
jgi:hypothetical protein